MFAIFAGRRLSRKYTQTSRTRTNCYRYAINNGRGRALIRYSHGSMVGKFYSGIADACLGMRVCAGSGA